MKPTLSHSRINPQKAEPFLGDIPGVLRNTPGAVYLPVEMSRTCESVLEMVGTQPSGTKIKKLPLKKSKRGFYFFHDRHYVITVIIRFQKIFDISSRCTDEVPYSFGERIFSLLVFSCEPYRFFETITRCLPLTKKVSARRGVVTGYSYRRLYQLDGHVCCMYASTSKYRSAPHKLSEPRV